MDELKFNSLEDLYKKLLPALRTKINDFKKEGVSYVKEEDIWNYLNDKYWKNKSELTLGEMVNDILCEPIEKIIKYRKDNILNNPYNLRGDKQ